MRTAEARTAQQQSTSKRGSFTVGEGGGAEHSNTKGARSASALSFKQEQLLLEATETEHVNANWVARQRQLAEENKVRF